MTLRERQFQYEQVGHHSVMHIYFRIEEVITYIERLVRALKDGQKLARKDKRNFLDNLPLI